MPPAPTLRMRILARRWLTDTVSFAAVTYATDTRPLGKATTTTSDPIIASALIRQPSVQDVDTQTARRDVRDLLLWVDETGSQTATTPNELAADDGVTLLTADDGTTVLTADFNAGATTVVNVDPVAGQRCTIVACGDASLVGKAGEVVSVERDSVRAVRRLTVRITNDD